MLRGIERKSRQWRQTVDEIVHDRQSEFDRLIKLDHDLFSRAKPGTLKLIGMKEVERVEMRAVAGSKLRISTSEDSAGIQFTDVVLWLMKKAHKAKWLPPAAGAFLNYLLRTGEMYDLSIESIETGLAEYFEKLNQVELTPEQLEKGQEMIDFDEKRTLDKMREYELRKISRKPLKSDTSETPED